MRTAAVILAAVLVIVMLATAFMGCGPHNAKHYYTRGPVQHFPDCRPKCEARKAGDWHERRRAP